MTQDSTETIAALLGSRICHDLISPIGAVNNGLELLTLTGVPHGPEMELVSDSAANANARIGLFRLAFGVASEDQLTRREELCKIWTSAMSDRKLDLNWHGPESLPRPLAQTVVLSLLCLDKALPQGGVLSVNEANDTWTITATGPALNIKDELWNMVAEMSQVPVDPAHVQFILLPRYLSQIGRRCRVDITPDRVTMAF